MSVLLELPVPVVQGAHLPGLEPPGDAVEVEGVVAHPPGHGALFAGGAGLVGLALDAQVHDVVPGHCPMSKMYMMIKVGMCQCLQELNV